MTRARVPIQQLERRAAIGLIVVEFAAVLLFLQIAIGLPQPNAALDILLAVLGTLGGYVLGVWWNRTQLAQEAQEEKNNVVKALVSSLALNKYLAEQVIDQMNKGDFPSFPLDRNKLSAITLRAEGIFSDPLLRDIDWHRFQIEHVSSRIDTAQVILSVPGVSDEGSLPRAQMAYVLQSLRAHCEKVIQGTDPLLKRIEMEYKEIETAVQPVKADPALGTKSSPVSDPPGIHKNDP